MVAFASFGDVVRQDRKIKRAAILNIADDFRRERKLGAEPTLLDLSKNTDGPNRVLVDSIVMVHVELHHRHDPPEVGNEAA